MHFNAFVPRYLPLSPNGCLLSPNFEYGIVGCTLCCQVLNLKLRSAALAGQPLPEPDKELDYVTTINRYCQCCTSHYSGLGQVGSEWFL